MIIKMKVISCFFLLAGIASTLSASAIAENETGLDLISGDKLTREGATLTATVNNYADQLMRNMDIMVLKAGLDPMIVPDIETKISRRILLITYWGKLKLSKIKVKDFSTIHRYDDAVITYDKDAKTMKIDIPLELKDIEFKCHYKATLMGLGPSGGLDGKMKSVRMITSIEIDFSTFKADVAQYKITHTDHITVHFHEFILIDWMINLLANTVTTIFKGLIINIVDKVVGGTLQASVNLINTVFEDIEEIIEGNSTAITAPILKNVGCLWCETKYYVS